MRENDAGQVFVANLTAIPIESVADFDKIYSYVVVDPNFKVTNIFPVGGPQRIVQLHLQT